MSPEAIAERLEDLRRAIRAENISYGEIAELQGLAEHIEPGDVELLEWAGVPEFPEDDQPTRFVLIFNTDNEAFRDEDGNLNYNAVAETISNVASLVGNGNEWSNGNVRDSNGNAVGTFRLERDES